MSTEKTTHASQITVPTGVASVLGSLRARIRRYVLLEGAAVVVAVLGILFWVSWSIDYSLEPARFVRAVLLMALCGGVLWLVGSRVVLRSLRSMPPRSLALVLERRFPQLSDRLVTVIEMANKPVSTLSGAMLERTVNEVHDVVSGLNLADVFDAGPMRRAAGAAFLAIVSIGGYALADTSGLGIWAERNLLLHNTPWPRKTELALHVLAAPGERRVDFRNGVHKHPRGGDLTLVATVVPGKIPPDRVQMPWSLVTQRGGNVEELPRHGAGEFRHTLSAWQDDVHLWLRGGDFSSPQPWTIQIVPPPQIDSFTLHTLYPSYMQRNTLDDETGEPIRDAVAVRGATVPLPVGSNVRLQARSNKPLLDASVSIDTAEIRLFPGRARLVDAAEGTETDLPSDEFHLDSDGRGFVVHLFINPASAPASKHDGGPALRIRPESLVRVMLHDSDDIFTADPIRIAISGIPDVAPSIEAERRGIGASITRQASIPVGGVLSDDYGLASSEFSYRVNDTDEDMTRSFGVSVNGRTRVEFLERFEVLPLDLSPGRKLHLNIVAKDHDTLTGPHRTSSERVTFTIVSNEELLAVIANRELNLRRRLEQIVDDLKKLRRDYLTLQAKWKEVRPGLQSPASERPVDLREKLSGLEASTVTFVERTLIGVRKSSNETAGVEQAFRDIREELVNNAIPDIQNTLSRLDLAVISPLRAINTTHYTTVDEALTAVRPVAGDGARNAAPLDAVGDPFDVVISRLEAVLSQILKEQDFSELVQTLRDILEQQKQLNEKTKAEQKRKLIERLGQ